MTMHKMVYRPSHPKASKSGDVYEHVIVAERALGRFMPAGSEIHHVDGNPRNNAASNLVICQDKAYHKLLHARTRVVRAGGNPNTQKICGYCRELKPFDAFGLMRANKSTGRQSRCLECGRISDAIKRRLRKVAA